MDSHTPTAPPKNEGSGTASPEPPTWASRLVFDLSSTPALDTNPPRYTREKPISVLVGHEKVRYFVHKGPFVAKSPFFRAILKDCWDGKQEEIELNMLSSKGFDVVVEWVYSGQLHPELVGYNLRDKQCWNDHLCAYKAADILMIDRLQNQLILNEAAWLRENDQTYKSISPLQTLHDQDLCHTKYYGFVLKLVIENMADTSDITSKEWNDQMKCAEEYPQLLINVLTNTREWLQKPWESVLEGDLSEFLVKIKEE